MQLDFTTDGSLEGVITLSINRNDYEENLQKSIKKYQKTMRFPGFRLGKAPIGLVKMQLETELIREEANRLIQSKIADYYNENRDKIIFMPMMNDLEEDFTWENKGSFIFTFRVALKSAFSVDLDALATIESKELKLTPDVIDDEIAHLRRKYGEIVYLDQVKDVDGLVLVFNVNELNEFGNWIEDGFSGTARIEGDEIPKSLLTALLGKKINDVFELDLKAILSDDELSGLFDVDKLTVQDFSKNFEIEMLGHIVLKEAAIDEEFYGKIFNDGSVNDEETFRARIGENLKAFFEEEVLVTLVKRTEKALLENTKIDLPISFMREWFNRNAEIDDRSKVEEYLADFIEATKWTLILEELNKEYGITVSDEEVKKAIKSYVIHKYPYDVKVMGSEYIERMAMSLYERENFRIDVRQNLLASNLVREMRNKRIFTQIELEKEQIVELLKSNVSNNE